MYTIREATEQDWPQIWDIFQQVVCAGDTYAYPPTMSSFEAQTVWMSVPKVTFVALRNDGVVATYYVKDNQPGLGAHVCNAGYMVRKDQRGLGLGTRLCEHSLGAARIMGYTAMQFNLVVSTNTATVKLWQKCGFDIVGTLPKSFQHAELGLVDTHVMYQILNKEDVTQ